MHWVELQDFTLQHIASMGVHNGHRKLPHPAEPAPNTRHERGISAASLRNGLELHLSQRVFWQHVRLQTILLQSIFRQSIDNASSFAQPLNALCSAVDYSRELGSVPLAPFPQSPLRVLD